MSEGRSFTSLGLREITRRGGVPTADIIRRSVRVYTQYVEEHPLQFRFIVSERGGGPAPVRNAIRNEVRHFVHEMAHDLRQLNAMPTLSTATLEMICASWSAQFSMRRPTSSTSPRATPVSARGDREFRTPAARDLPRRRRVAGAVGALSACRASGRKRLPLLGARRRSCRRGPRMVRHQERRARNGHDLVAARTRRVELTARSALEVRERRLTVWAGTEPRIRHGYPFVVNLG
jgi:hypothetical protein